MRKLLLVLIIVLCSLVSVHAEEGNVSYTGRENGFVFEPGSQYSLTDLFTEFKGVMPGDTLTQEITVRNTASGAVKVKMYMRSLGAQAGSEDFLSQLNMKVELAPNNTMGYMFDANAAVSDGLTDWYYLGTLYRGGEVNLVVSLEVPVTLDPKYMNQVGYLDWEFMIEEFPVESTDPLPPNTGDDSNLGLYALGIAGSALLIIVLLAKKKQDKKEGKHEEE